MRGILFVGLTALWWGLAGGVWAQKTDTSQFKDIGGKSLEQWIKEIHSKDRSKAEAAIRTILLYPPERAYQAVPDLLSELKKHTFNSPLDISIRVNIPIALGLILDNAKGADPKHVQEAVTLLSRLLRDTQSIVRYRAAEALGRIGPDAKSAIPEIIVLLKDPGTWEVRQAAAMSLGKIAYDNKAGPTPQILTALYGALGDPTSPTARPGDSASQVRLAAIQSLTYLGNPADPNLRLGLMKALEPVAFKDTDPTVQIWAYMSLMSLHDEVTPQRLMPIIKMVKHQDMLVRGQAIQAVMAAAGLGPSKVKAAVPALIDNLTDPDVPPGIVLYSTMALGRIGVFASDAIPTLQKISTDAKQPEPLKTVALEAIDLLQGKTKGNK